MCTLDVVCRYISLMFVCNVDSVCVCVVFVVGVIRRCKMLFCMYNLNTSSCSSSFSPYSCLLPHLSSRLCFAHICTFFIMYLIFVNIQTRYVENLLYKLFFAFTFASFSSLFILICSYFHCIIFKH